MDKCFQIRQLLDVPDVPPWQAFCNLLAFYVAGLPAALVDIPNCTTMETRITKIYKHVASLVRNQFRVGRRLFQSSLFHVNYRKSDRAIGNFRVIFTIMTLASRRAKASRGRNARVSDSSVIDPRKMRAKFENVSGEFPIIHECADISNAHLCV